MKKSARQPSALRSKPSRASDEKYDEWGKPVPDSDPPSSAEGTPKAGARSPFASPAYQRRYKKTVERIVSPKATGGHAEGEASSASDLILREISLKPLQRMTSEIQHTPLDKACKNELFALLSNIPSDSPYKKLHALLKKLQEQRQNALQVPLDAKADRATKAAVGRMHEDFASLTGTAQILVVEIFKSVINLRRGVALSLTDQECLELFKGCADLLHICIRAPVNSHKLELHGPLFKGFCGRTPKNVSLR